MDARAEDAYLTVAEVATLVRLSPKSIYRLMKADATFPCVKVCGSLRIPRARLQRWLAARTQGLPPR